MVENIEYGDEILPKSTNNMTKTVGPRHIPKYLGVTRRDKFRTEKI